MKIQLLKRFLSHIQNSTPQTFFNMFRLKKKNIPITQNKVLLFSVTERQESRERVNATSRVGFKR